LPDGPGYCVRLYAIADKYDIPALQKLAAEEFEDVSDTCDSPQQLEKLITAIRKSDECTSPTEKTLWNIAIPIMTSNMAVLLQEPSFKELLYNMPALTHELLAHLDQGQPQGCGEHHFVSRKANG